MFSGYVWAGSEPTSPEILHDALQMYRLAGKRIVTANGCFDLLHTGHIHFLSAAKALGDVLVVGLNSDLSVRHLKGIHRPIVQEADRATLLAALRPVDHVVVFDDNLPNEFLSFVRPNFHCKGGDYSTDDLPEAEVVWRYGGEVRILPLCSGYSTSNLIERIVAPASESNNTSDEDEFSSWITTCFLQSGDTLHRMAYRLIKDVEDIKNLLTTALQAGHKVMVCGNGGSAATAQHFASELVGRFRQDRSPLPIIALTTDTSTITALGNDYGFEQVFARQIAALGQAGDVLIAISTSGKSANILAAINAAHALGIRTVVFTGEQTSHLKDMIDLVLPIPSQDVAQIQQGHMAAFHAICDLIEHEQTR